MSCEAPSGNGYAKGTGTLKCLWSPTDTAVATTSPAPGKVYPIGGYVRSRAALPTIRPTSRSRAVRLATEDGRRIEERAARKLGEALIHDGVAPLLALRLRSGLTQQQLSEMTGLRQPHLSRLENGLVESPDRNTVEQIASALGINYAVAAEAIHNSFKQAHRDGDS